MNATAAHMPAGQSEFAAAGVTEAASQVIAPPRVAESPATFECKLVEVVVLPNDGAGTNTTVFGQVVGVHISDDIIKDGFVDPTIYQPLARMGYLDYTTVTDVFTLQRPE